MRVVLAEHVAHGTGRLLVFGGILETKFRHRIDDAPLDRLEPIADMRQGTIEDDVHGIVEVSAFGIGLESKTLNAVGTDVEGFTHGWGISGGKYRRMDMQWTRSVAEACASEQIELGGARRRAGTHTIGFGHIDSHGRRCLRNSMTSRQSQTGRQP